MNVRYDNALVAGQWQHIVLTWDGNSSVASVKVYRNGVVLTNPYGSGGVGTKPSDAAYNLYIGAENGAYGINGGMDDVRFYNRILTDAEITELASQ